jgi:3'-5' exoribonuclease
MIVDIKDKDNVSSVFLVKEASCLKTKKDKRPYTVLNFIDKTGEIKAFIWDKHLSHIRAGSFVKASGTAALHNDLIVLRLKDTGITPVPKPSNLDNYLHALDAMTISSLWEELSGTASAMQDPFYKAIVFYLLNHHDELGDGFNLKTCPLNDKKDGNYAGALLEHIVYCLRHCKAIHQNYFDRNCPIDPDLLATLAILHHVGKLRSFKNIFSVELTTKARTMGSVAMTREVLQDIISKVEMKADDWNETKELKLKCGAVSSSDETMKSNTIEAAIVQSIQVMDRTIGLYARTLNFAKAGKETVWCPEFNVEIING